MEESLDGSIFIRNEFCVMGDKAQALSIKHSDSCQWLTTRFGLQSLRYRSLETGSKLLSRCTKEALERIQFEELTAYRVDVYQVCGISSHS